MSRQALEQQLGQSLTRLETCLETPRVPGEVPAWTKQALDAFNDLRPKLERQVEDAHANDFTQIGEQDAALLPRVDQLKAEDAAIAEQFAELSRRLERIAQVAPQAEPNELQAESEISEFADEALLLVLRIRKQETAITTWLLEAFNRDRGIAD